MQLWIRGQLEDQRVDVTEPMTLEEAADYGVDPSGPLPEITDSDAVDVPAVMFSLHAELTHELKQLVDPMKESDYFAVDTYLETLRFVQQRISVI
jgi:hypothetical protein